VLGALHAPTCFYGFAPRVLGSCAPRVHAGHQSVGCASRSNVHFGFALNVLGGFASNVLSGFASSVPGTDAATRFALTAQPAWCAACFADAPTCFGVTLQRTPFGGCFFRRPASSSSSVMLNERFSGRTGFGCRAAWRCFSSISFVVTRRAAA